MTQENIPIVEAYPKLVALLKSRSPYLKLSAFFTSDCEEFVIYIWLVKQGVDKRGDLLFESRKPTMAEAFQDLEDALSPDPGNLDKWVTIIGK